MASPYVIKKIINKTFSGRFMLSRLSHYAFFGRIIDFLPLLLLLAYAARDYTRNR
jgi:hypothetical protein